MPDLNSIDTLLRERRTIHDFTEELPPWSLVEAALESAIRAPNHHLSQPWRFYHLGPQSKQAIVELNAELVGLKKGPQAAEKKRQRWSQIPGWLLVTCMRNEDELRAREDYAACCCAVQNLMLSLWPHGIGCKWTTGAVTRHPKFYDAVWVNPALEETVGLIWYGYPKDKPQTPRKALAQKLVQLP